MQQQKEEEKNTQKNKISHRTDPSWNYDLQASLRVPKKSFIPYLFAFLSLVVVFDRTKHRRVVKVLS